MDTTTAAASSSEVLERFLASCWTTRTRDNYRFILTRWLDWCHTHGRDPPDGADAAALETLIAELKTAGYAPNQAVGRGRLPQVLRVRWLPLTWIAAICLPPVGIVVRVARDSERLRRHELVHWEQYRRHGFVGYYLGYLVAWVRAGFLRTAPLGDRGTGRRTSLSKLWWS